MSDRAAVMLEKLKTGLWPVPLLMAVLTLLLFAAVRAADQALGPDLALRSAWLYSGSGEDASNLLATLVTGIITMSSIVFSITIVTLTLAAAQFGSRLIRIYMSDVRTKLALGSYTMTIVYCLLALRSVDGAMAPEQVPHFVVTLGFVFGLVCVLVLLFFLHFVARSIIADEVIGSVAAELEESLLELAPLRPGAAAPVDPRTLAPRERGALLRSSREGYIQAITHERMVAVAAEHGLAVHLHVRAGEFVCKHGWLGTVHPAAQVTPDLEDALRKAVLIGEVRTPTQDLEFSIRQLVDIALRALSPGINDANTAIVVVDRLRGALSRLLARSLPQAVHCDASGEPRVIGKHHTYAGIFDAALNQIRQSAAPHPAVIIALLRGLGPLAQHVRLPEQREALLHHARLIADAGLREVDEARDRADIEAACTETERQLHANAELALREFTPAADMRRDPLELSVAEPTR